MQKQKKARLMVCTYNGSSHLESIALNVPNLLCWNAKATPLRKNAKPIHQKLYELGILHYEPQKAAAFLTQIFDHTLEWWQQPEIQQVRKEFCEQFAATTQHYTQAWQQIIVDLAKKT